MIRYILHVLANNERLVQKLSESYPMRRAAQLVAIVVYRGKFMIEDVKLRNPEQLRDLLNKLSQSLKEVKKR